MGTKGRSILQSGNAAVIAATAFGLLAFMLPVGALIIQASEESYLPFREGLMLLGRTSLQAGWSTLGALVIGIPLGFLVAHSGGRWTRAILTMPFSAPTVVVSFAMIGWFGKQGILGQNGIADGLLYSLSAVILAHVLLNAPWVALSVAQARSSVPEDQIQAARSLGAGCCARVRWVLAPYLVPAILASAIQVFAFCASSFAIVLLLGGGPPVETLETAIYYRLRGGTPDFTGALTFALMLVAVLCPLAVISEKLALRLPSSGRPLGEVARGAARSGRVLRIFTGAVAALFLVPLVPVVISAPWSAIVENWRIIAPATVISVKIAFLSAVLCTSVAFACATANNRWSAFIALSPSGISALALGTGFWLAFSHWVDPFEGSLLAIVMIQATLFQPFAYRFLWPVALGTRRDLIAAARTLGATPLQAFSAVEWPRWRGPLARCLAMIAAVSVGEVAVVSLFYSEDLTPLPLLLSRTLGQYRFHEAHAIAALLLLIAFSLSLLSGLSEGGKQHAPL